MRKEKKVKKSRKKLPFKRDLSMMDNLSWEIRDLLAKGTAPYDAIMEVYRNHDDYIDMDDIIDIVDDDLKRLVMVEFFEKNKTSFFSKADQKLMKTIIKTTPKTNA